MSCQGRVRRLATGRVLRPARTDRGYWKVNLGRRAQAYVHQLVAEAFCGPRPSPSHEVDHLDWDRANNAVSNLRWLHRSINACRWKDRVGGRNVWSTPDDPAPEEWEAMSDEEREHLTRELQAAGWHG